MQISAFYCVQRLRTVSYFTNKLFFSAQATGLGGTVSRGHDTSKLETMQAVPERTIKVRFNADVASSMRWNFKPQQTEVKVC